MIIFIGSKNYKDSDNIYKNDKEALITIPLFILIIIGILLLLISAQFTIISFKPATSFEDMLKDAEVKEGIHIEGEITYITDYFATEGTSYYYSYSSGNETGRYYLIPTSDNYISIKNDSSISMKELNQLMDETYEFLESGKEPETKIFVQGTAAKMDEELIHIYKEYLSEAGYSEKEIESMGEPLIITRINFHLMQVFFFTGILITCIPALLLIYIRHKKNELS